MTGWWFGTWLDYDFPYIGNVIIPTDFHIFSEGWLNHQPGDFTKLIGYSHLDPQDH